MKAVAVAAAPKGEASYGPLWKWTGVSAAGHAIFLAILCLVSAQLEKHKQAELKAKEEEKTAAAAVAEKAAAEKAAAASAAAAEKKKANPNAGAENPKAAGVATGTTNDVKTAEKILGIDKVASPDELKKGFKGKDTDDLLKDLK
jgi:colicin import membrane protein